MQIVGCKLTIRIRTKKQARRSKITNYFLCLLVFGLFVVWFPRCSFASSRGPCSSCYRSHPSAENVCNPTKWGFLFGHCGPVKAIEDQSSSFFARCCLGNILGGVHFSQLHKGDKQSRTNSNNFFFSLCCLGKIPGGAPFSQLHKGGKQSREDRP